jgi:ABC-2 type transport system ATP-binding protein
MTSPLQGPVGVVTTYGLGKRYGSTWALDDCTIAIPEGRVTALVGPNGAGKSTLLRLLAGLSTPTTGSASVLGRPPGQDVAFLDEIGYLAQDIPLYGRLSAEEHIHLIGGLNHRWDGDGARSRLLRLNVPTDRPVSTLSGGQRAQVALSLALAKHPRLLLLDEPVAALDPLARREFLATLSEAVADGGLSVILSSHLVHDLQRVCDHLLLLSSSRTQFCGDIDDVLSSHRMLVGPRRSVERIESGLTVIKATQTERQTRLIVKWGGVVLDPSWEVDELGLEDIILAYMGQADDEWQSHLRTAEASR